MEEKIKHLEFIQNAISRLNSNSYQIKSWMVTVVAAVLAIYATTKVKELILVGIIPTIIFWIWDSYCLTQERRFRALYNDIAGISENPKSLKPFEMNPNIYSNGKGNFWNVLFTKTMWLAYFLIILFLIVLYLILDYK